MDRLKEMKEIEERTADFYRVNAQDFKDEGIKKIFSTLASNTEKHLKLLDDLESLGEKFESGKEAFDKDLFKCLDDCGCAYLRTEELATYVAGSDLERNLISKYDEVKDKISDEQVIEILEYISKKHKDALFVLTDMIELLNRTSDWVESAEFTLREPY